MNEQLNDPTAFLLARVRQLEEEVRELEERLEDIYEERRYA